MKAKDLNKMEAGLLLYLETCLVDGHGRVEGQRMNKPEMRILQKWSANEFISFGRLSMRAIQKLRGDPRGHIFTHYVRFSDEAWKIAHAFRRERSERMIGKKNAELLRETT